MQKQFWNNIAIVKAKVAGDPITFLWCRLIRRRSDPESY
jgi:hypothetical protein